MNRAWNNEFSAWSTGIPGDVQFDEMTFYIVPKHILPPTFPYLHAAEREPVKLHPDFWSWSLPERKAGLSKK